MKNVNDIDMKRAAIISDLSCFGKCSLTVALPVISHFGIEAVPLPTALLSTHTGGFDNFEFFNMTDKMEKILEHWRSLDIRFDTIYTGYLCGNEQIEFVKSFVEHFGEHASFLLVDPVMADDGRLYSGFGHGFVPAMRSLCAISDMITPNATEAAMLVGFEPDEVIYGSRSEECLVKLRELCHGSVVITGIKRDDGSIGYLCYDREKDNIFSIFSPELDRIMPGCGDTFASALCAKITGGETVEDSVRYAADFTRRCIKQTAEGGHWYGLEFEKVLKEN